MKKLLTLIAGIAFTVTAAQSSTYLCIYTTEGGDVPEVIAPAGLVLTTEDDNLVATAPDAASLSIPLTTLVGMEFSDEEPAGVAQLLKDGDMHFTLYDMKGLKAGEFSSMDDASSSLSQGIYVMRTNSNKTVKILIGK